MTINYNIDHNLLKLKVFRETKMTASQRMVTLITLSQIAHFHKYVGKCTFAIRQMSEDLGVKRSHFSDAIKLLKTNKLIVEIIPYDRKTQTPATYRLTPGMIKALATLSTRPGPNGGASLAPIEPKAGPIVGQVNNYK